MLEVFGYFAGSVAHGGLGWVEGVWKLDGPILSARFVSLMWLWVYFRTVSKFDEFTPCQYKMKPSKYTIICTVL